MVILFQKMDIFVSTSVTECSCMHNKSDKAIVLVVDSHQEVLDFISEDLGGTFVVLQARSVLDALVVLQTEHVDLIVSELALPEQSGFDFCLKVKNDPLLGHIPFILLTALNSLQAKIEGLGSGADTFIEKPFSPSFLRAQIESLLRNRKTVRAYTKEQDIPKPRLESEDPFVQKVIALIVKHLNDQELCVDMLAEKLHVSRPTLYRKVRETSNLSPNELINLLRLDEAKELMKQKSYRIYEISDRVGFTSSSSFIRSFRKQFGVSPKEWMLNLS